MGAALSLMSRPLWPWEVWSHCVTLVAWAQLPTLQLRKVRLIDVM